MLLLRTPWSRWGFALLAALFALALNLLLQPAIGGRIPLLPLFGALIATGLFCGMLPGLAVLAFSTAFIVVQGLGDGRTLADAQLREWVLLAGFVIAGGASMGVAAYARRVVAELQHEIRRKDEFVAMLAHELRNPMAAIRYAAALLDDESSPATRRQARDVLHRQTEHVSRLLQDLLDTDRIARNVIALERQPLDICAVARECAEVASPAMQQAGHELRLSIPAQPIRVDADRTRMAQVIGNLLDNAVKYTEAGGIIELRVAATAHEVQVAVEDNGIGVPPEQQDKVFQKYSPMQRRAHGRRGGGLGIGLALVKQLVELHGGRVQVDSGGYGMGSRFTVTLPRLPARDEGESASNAASAA